MKVYSAQQKLGKEVEDHAHAIFLEAMRRVGEMLAATGPNGSGERSDGGRPKITLVFKPTLKDIGLTTKESSLAQKIAALPEEDFQQIKEGANAAIFCASADSFLLSVRPGSS
jgi:hypothetical protein